MKSVRIKRKLNLTLFVCLFIGIVLHPTIAFADLGTIPVWISSDAEYTTSSAWGDADGDGDLDLAVGNNGSVNRLYINEGKDEEGNTLFSSQLIGTDGKYTQSVAWGDADGDGDLDLAVGNRYAANQLYVNEGVGEDGHITFSAQLVGVESKNTLSIAWGDANGDGVLDLAVGNSYALSRLYINRGDAAQFFIEDDAQQIGTEAFNTQEIAWGDVTGDGLLDLVVGNSRSVNHLYVNSRDSADTIFPESTEIGTESRDTRTIAVGDVNGDDFLDLAVGNQGVDQLILNDGQGNLTISQDIGDSSSSRAVVLEDADGDGDLDLTIGGFNLKHLYINAYGENETLFSSNQTIGTGEGNVYDVAWGDADGDGDLDLAVANYRSANQVYSNQTDNRFGTADTPLDTNDPFAAAWGDADGDGDPDLAVVNRDGTVETHINDWLTGQFSVQEIGSVTRASHADVAWGDADGDGDLDLAVITHATVRDDFIFSAYRTTTMLYLNENGQFSAQEIGDSTVNLRSQTIAWGDADGDGDLDLAVANDGRLNQLYLNDGTGNFPDVQTIGTGLWNSYAIAWGDADGDGDLDLAVGNFNHVNQLYVNEGEGVDGDVLFVPHEMSGDARATTAVAWADADGDGDLDLVVGNDGDVNQMYVNLGDNRFSVRNVESDVQRTTQLAWGDADGDGDLDVAVGNINSPGQLYINEGGMQFGIEAMGTAAQIAWGDADRDGDLDLTDGSHLFFNQSDPTSAAINQATHIDISEPSRAGLYATQAINSDIIPIEYVLYDREADVVGRVAFFYSLDGGGNWQPAISTTDTITTALETSSYPSVTVTNRHTFYWDVSASGLFGQSDNVVLRAVAYPQIADGEAGTFSYSDQTPKLLHPSSSTETFPFRVRGTQVRVVNDGGVLVDDAVVYQQTGGRTQYEWMGTGSEPFQTNSQGYLSGRGALNNGDSIIALRPITATTAYTLYHTSEAVSTILTDPYTLDGGGVHTLTVSADNQLLLFDLTVSLEWDARNDTAFLSQLESDLKRTSEIVYDLTNGQAALGRITVYHERERWNYADIVIHASNNVRPSAIAGGIVPGVVTDTIQVVTGVLTTTGSTVVLPQTEVITNTYIPGQIRMGPTWNRFGEPDGTIGEDWPRTLAHELGHYLFFLPDNYLGVDSETGLLKFTDCQGSVMSNPYSDGESEFLSDDNWDGECLDTLANRYLDRTDWDTIERFYPIRFSGENSGPADQPLNLTQVSFVDRENPAETLDDGFFELTDSDGNSYPIFSGQGDAFLIKTQADDDPTNDYVQALGSPIGNQVQARGAETGDELCVYDYGRETFHTGCLIVGEYAEPVELTAVPNWQPNVTVTQVNSQTFAITVTNAFSESVMTVQLVSALGSMSNDTSWLASDVLTMTQTADGNFISTINLFDPAFSGYVYIAVPDSNKQLLVDFISVENWGGSFIEWGGSFIEWGGSFIEWGGSFIEWGGSFIEWGGNVISWGGSFIEWGAPSISSDGQVMLFPANPFSEIPAVTLQKLTFPPDLPIWLTPVGQAYQVDGEVPNGSIVIRYLGRDVDLVYENDLAIYFTDDNGVEWERLDTQIDTDRNHAIAPATAQGVYVLVVTVEAAVLQPGWNNVGQPVQPTQPVIDDYHLTYQIPITEAITSIDGKITAVAWLNDSTLSNTKSDEWRFYYPDVVSPFAPLVNDLSGMMLDAYWIHATETVTWHVGVEEPALSDERVGNRATPYLPPATYYGWLTSTETVRDDIIVEAKIRETVCGTAEPTPLDGRLAYVIRVSATAPYPCGTPESVVYFEVGGTLAKFEVDGETSNIIEWDNRVAHFISLTFEPTGVGVMTTQSSVGDSRTILAVVSITLALSTLFVLHRRRAA